MKTENLRMRFSGIFEKLLLFEHSAIKTSRYFQKYRRKKKPCFQGFFFTMTGYQPIASGIS